MGAADPPRPAAGAWVGRATDRRGERRGPGPGELSFCETSVSGEPVTVATFDHGAGERGIALTYLCVGSLAVDDFVL
jgi:hypothetical protein